MTRIAPLAPGEGAPVARLALREVKRRLGRVPESFAVTAHHQGILSAAGAYELVLERCTRVDVVLKELAVIKAASVVGCEFCLDIGSWLARTHGVTEDQLRELVDHRASDAFSATEKLVLDYAEAMTRTSVAVPDELFERLRESFDDGQLVELTAAIAWENYRARFNAALGIEAQGFSEGALCALPERPVPA
jgi:AhpD family alkylhydroperoxidase